MENHFWRVSFHFAILNLRDVILATTEALGRNVFSDLALGSAVSNTLHRGTSVVISTCISIGDIDRLEYTCDVLVYDTDLISDVPCFF